MLDIAGKLNEFLRASPNVEVAEGLKIRNTWLQRPLRSPEDLPQSDSVFCRRRRASLRPVNSEGPGTIINPLEPDLGFNLQVP